MMKPAALALVALVALFGTRAALADDGPNMAGTSGSSEAPLPRSTASTFRILPVVGESDFVTSPTVNTNNFNQFSAGVFGDFGSEMWTFETGILSLNATKQNSADSAAVTINSWGIPLLAKLNLSGHPHQTVFLKAGVMPFTASGSSNSSFDAMAVGGVGGDIPLGRNSSIVLDAAYNRLFTRNGNLTDYQGISLLAGLSLNI